MYNVVGGNISTITSTGKSVHINGPSAYGVPISFGVSSVD